MSSEWIYSVEELARDVSAKVLGLPGLSFSRVGTDSRADLTDRLFVALKGDRFDGHDFVEQAIKAGAKVLLVDHFSEKWSALLNTVCFVVVTDTLKALQDFANVWRRKNRFVVAGITGSNGKTSTKEFLLALLKPHFRVHASKGSFNNHWGVPISILEAGPEHTHLILEMGMNHKGEIARLCEIAEPDVVVSTMVGRAHIGELGSQEAIAEAKEEIYLHSPKAVHIFNMDNEWTMKMQSRSKAQQIWFSSFREQVDVRLRAERMNLEGLELTGQIRRLAGRAQVRVLGRHNVVNLMAASALALAVGMTHEQIWAGLSQIEDSSWGRNQVLILANGARVLFDAYNANPDSMQALLKNLFEIEVEGGKFLVVGDMKELGSFSASAHEELGEKVLPLGFQGIWYIGQESKSFMKGLAKGADKPPVVYHSPNVVESVAKEFLSHLKPGDLVAIKASRGMMLENVLQHWPLITPLGKKP